MALTPVPGLSGQLAAAKASLYDATGAAVFFGAVFVNTTAGALTMNLYHYDGTASRRLIAVNQSIPANSVAYYKSPRGIVLQSGDKIEGDASAATSVDYDLMVLTIT